MTVKVQAAELAHPCSWFQVLQGLGHVGLLRLAAALGGDGLLGGIVPGRCEWKRAIHTVGMSSLRLAVHALAGISLFLLAFLHRLDFSRIHDVGMLELRELFGWRR